MLRALTFSLLAGVLASGPASAQDFESDWNAAVDAINACSTEVSERYYDSVIAEPMAINAEAEITEAHLGNAVPLTDEQIAVFNQFQLEMEPCRDGFRSSLAALDPMLGFTIRTTFDLQSGLANQLIEGSRTPGEYLQARRRLGEAYPQVLLAVAEEAAAGTRNTPETDPDLAARITDFLNASVEG